MNLFNFLGLRQIDLGPWSCEYHCAILMMIPSSLVHYTYYSITMTYALTSVKLIGKHIKCSLGAIIFKPGPTNRSWEYNELDDCSNNAKNEFVKCATFVFSAVCARMHVKKIMACRLQSVNCCIEDKVQGLSLPKALLTLKGAETSRLKSRTVCPCGNCMASFL